MNISEKGKELIKSYEGCQLAAYRCPSNVLTIGWGHTEGVCEGQVITQEVADALFDEDMQRYEEPVRQYNVNQNKFDALTSFCYNCGSGALEDVMTSGDITGTISMYMHGNGGVVLQGLVRRRKEEIELYNTPIDIIQEQPVAMAEEYKVNSYDENGIFTCNVEAINFRNNPLIDPSNPIIDKYYEGENVSYDFVYITNLYTYISWTSLTGERRYMPITDRTTGEKWGYCE